MKEIYRSFEGQLNPDTPTGYIVSEGGSFYLVEYVSARMHEKDQLFRIPKELVKRYDDPEEVMGHLVKIEFCKDPLNDPCFVEEYKNVQFFDSAQGKWMKLGKYRDKLLKEYK